MVSFQAVFLSIPQVRIFFSTKKNLQKSPPPLFCRLQMKEGKSNIRTDQRNVFLDFLKKKNQFTPIPSRSPNVSNILPALFYILYTMSCNVHIQIKDIFMYIIINCTIYIYYFIYMNFKCILYLIPHTFFSQ